MTDLVGSTAIADRVGPVSAEALRLEHFSALRAALGRNGGLEIKNLGDGLMVVFSSASHALTCAVEMQQAVEARNRRSTERLEVRIGISFGEATVEHGDYFGAPVVESSRLCAHASGGQVIVNALLRQVAGARATRGLRALGGIQLKGIAKPVEAFELEWAPILAAGIALPQGLSELPASGFVGRRPERARLSELWQEACAGSLRLALIFGEAGVGKTRLSAQLARQAHRMGATVLYGRCREDLGLPYQPWAEALGHFVREAPRLILEGHAERFGGDMARLVPALAERMPDLPAPHQSDPETERYLLYAAAAGLLEGAAEQAPLLLILDDLHWADGPTLSLLRHVVTAGASTEVMVLATYRDSDLTREHPMLALLADLHRAAGVERLKLSGLHSDDVLAMMEASSGHELDGRARALGREITRETAGNPFFAGELLRHLAESGAIVQEEGGRWRFTGEIAQLGLPESVREVIGRRVARLGADARTALSAAAVMGRDFELDLLLAVLGLSEARLLDLLERAVVAALLYEDGERAGRFTFAHALVEHTLYEDLGATRRSRLHRQIAEAIEKQCGDGLDERLDELATHWLAWAAATPGADAAKAVHYAQRAARRALEQLAPDEAVRLYRQALELQAQAASCERCELLIGLGEAQRQVGDAAFRETLLDASALAREQGDGDLLCRAVLANNRGWASTYGEVDSERVQALQDASEALPDDDQRRAQVLALLACELQFAAEPARCQRVARRAIEIARAGGDPMCLAHTIANAGLAVVVPHTLQERQRLLDELEGLERRLDDPRLSSRAAAKRMMAGLEAGDRVQAEAGLATIRAFATAVPEPFVGYLRPLLEFGWALLGGDLEASERWTTQAYEIGTAAGQPDAATFFGAHLFHIRYFQGRTGDLVELVRQLAGEREDPSAWHAGATALALAQSGRAEQARELALAADFASVAHDEAWSIIMILWGDACSRLGISDRAGELYELLEPFSGQLAVSGAHVYGSIDWALGSLVAASDGGCEEAERHFALAAKIETRLGAPLLLARTRAGWSRALIARGQADDLDRAGRMLEQAEEATHRMSAGGIAKDVAECRAMLAAAAR